MYLEINKMMIDNFKGCSHAVYDFEDVTQIMGQNGAGKTTISDAWYWVFADCNTVLVKNPLVTPIGAKECISKVEIEIEIDGNACTVVKSQKFKEKTDDTGKTTSSVTNTYSINSVDKSYKDFVADMTYRGFDFEKFLILSNINAFTADTSKKGREEMRKVLFSMTNDLSDQDIAKGLNAPELNALLEKGYKMDEIEQMQKSTIKKITDTCGKDNATINARIDGLVSAKSKADVEALEKSKHEYETELESVKERIADIGKDKAEISAQIGDLKAKKSAILRKAENELSQTLIDMRTKISKLEMDKQVLMSKYNLAGSKAIDAQKSIDSLKESVENYRNLYRKVQDEVLDENDTMCPTCGREYEADRIKEIKADFEKSKTNRLKEYKKKAEELKKSITEHEKIMADAHVKHEDLHTEIGKLEHDIESHKAKLSMLPGSADVSDNEEYIAISNQISDLEIELAKSDDLKLQELSNRESYLNQMIRQVIGELAVFERNKEIDEQIESLRKERKNAEVNKADAERILNQVDEFKKQKNSLLTAEINSHFDIVNFKLFDYLKNGNYTEILEVMIDDKPMSSCANGSLITLAKLDVVKGLQKFFDAHYPVFVDDAALITDNVSERIDVDTQLILLIAKDGYSKIEFI